MSSLLPCDKLPPPKDCDGGGQVPFVIDFTAVFNRLLCDCLLLAKDSDTGGLGGGLLPLPELGLPLLLPACPDWQSLLFLLGLS